MDDTKARIEFIKERAPIAALQHAAQEEAVKDEFRARQELLGAVLTALRPAGGALSGPLPVRTSRSGCEVHGVEKGHKEMGKVSAIRVLPGLALVWNGPQSKTGEWGWYLDRAPWLGAHCGCFSYDWQPVAPDEVLNHVPLADVVEGIAQAIDEALTGNRLRSSLQFDARARKLRALAVLIGDASR